MRVNFLWIGDSLSKMEQLTLKSFLDYGHTSVLWAYNQKCVNIPEGVEIRDAGDIIPHNKVFSYTGTGDCRKGSYGGFSDIFRYYLLLKEGGWYCDMDTTCLKSFIEVNSKYEILFRPHVRTEVVGNIMKVPKGSKIMQDCIQETEKIINKNNGSWIRPVEILRDVVLKHNMRQYICPVEYFGNDNSEDLLKYVATVFLTRNVKMPEYAIHWCNEAISTGRWNHNLKRSWNTPIPTTLFYNLLKKHNLL
jgi:hypothetical protein